MMTGSDQQSLGSSKEPAEVFARARGELAAGRLDTARALLERITDTAPLFEAAWLQLLALDPPPLEEIELLEGFLEHHPQHRFAQAFRARLQDRQIVLLLQQIKPDTNMDAQVARSSLRLGDYLIRQQWVTPEQVEAALEEQRKLQTAGFEQRLGTILLMQGHLQPEQLATALAESLVSGFGEFGDYLVRSKVLTRDQVALALARQSALRAEQDQHFLDALTRYHRETRKGGILGRLAPAEPHLPERRRVPRLGEVMVSMGLLTIDQVEHVLNERQEVYDSLFG